MKKQYVAYYRVSTDRQGKSGLGLDAQREAVAKFLGTEDGYEIISEFTEVESGKRNKRPQLIAAIHEAEKHGAILIIAKLDRLSRNLAFIANLLESKIEIRAADHPTANKAMLQIMGVFAEMEADAISKRTKEALKVAKSRGVVLGKHGKQMKQDALVYGRSIWPTIKKIQKNGAQSLREVADAMNKAGVATPKGGKWYASSVKNLMDRMKG